MIKYHRQYSDSKDTTRESGLIYPEWDATCDMVLHMLSKLLKIANASLELVEFISHNDIALEVQNQFSVTRLWDLDLHILAFLSVSLFLESKFSF